MDMVKKTLNHLDSLTTKPDRAITHKFKYVIPQPNHIVHTCTYMTKCLHFTDDWSVTRLCTVNSHLVGMDGVSTPQRYMHGIIVFILIHITLDSLQASIARQFKWLWFNDMSIWSPVTTIHFTSTIDSIFTMTYTYNGKLLQNIKNLTRLHMSKELKQAKLIEEQTNLETKNRKTTVTKQGTVIIMCWS